MDELPQPRPVARALLHWTQREDAPAFAADLAELLDAAALTGWRRWARGWGQILSTLRRRGESGRHLVSPASRPSGSLATAGDPSSGVLRPSSGGRRPGSTGLRPRLALRLALRGLRKDPVTAGTAVLILAPRA